jgi:hypothetical protein
MTSEDLEYDPCRHGEQHPSFCSICRNEAPRQRISVYFTGGGQHFHHDPKCSALAEGQKIVSDRGGIPALVESGYLDTVKTTRKPCKTCTPKSLKR